MISKYELQGRDPSEVTDNVAEMMYLEHELMAVVRCVIISVKLHHVGGNSGPQNS